MRVGESLKMSDYGVWVEKYRPKTIDECVLESGIKKTLKSFIEKGEFPSLLLSGSAGIGKTTVARALCNELGMEWTIINSSDQRGIDVLRSQISSFASSVSLTSNSSLKAVILDEFDHSSQLLQTAMRGAVEEYAKVCRFIFTCNYPQKIIEPLHSRCSVITLDNFGNEIMQVKAGIMRRIMEILTAEKVEFDPACIAKIVECYFPDFRRMLNELQRIASVGNKIDVETLHFSDDNVTIKELVEILKDKDFRKMRQWCGTYSNIEPHVLFRKIYDMLLDEGFLVKENIPQAVLLIAEYQYRSVSVVDQEINNAAFLTELMTLLQ